MKKIFAILLMTVSVISFAQAGEHIVDSKHYPRSQTMETNRDGQISKKEFLKESEEIAEERFKRLDTNGDGKISEDEEMYDGHNVHMRKRMYEHDGYHY